jgi:PAS domain S-box-containing protein
MKGKHDNQEDREELIDELAQLRRRIAELAAENKKLQKSGERYRLIAKNTDDLVAVTTFALNPTYTYISPSHKKIMGYDPGDLLGRSGLDFIHPEDKKKVAPLLKKYLTGKIKGIFNGKIRDFSERIEYRVRDKAGGWHYLQSTVNIIKDKDELVFISRDITGQKKAEEERRELEEKLLQSEKMEAIGALAGGVAHDLNNTLSAIVNYPELLLLDLPEDSPHRTLVTAIQQAGERAAAIVMDLLTLAGKGVVMTEVVSLNDIVVDFFNSPEYEKLKSFYPGVHIETHPAKKSCNMHGSPIRLSKMLLNLFTNAMESVHEKKEGKVTVSTGNRYVNRPVKGYDHDVPVGEYVVLTVADNGAGMSPGDIKKIFMPFYTRKKMGRSGTGLGMMVVWGAVKDHKGYIVVSGHEGRETTVDLYFPVTREKLAATEEPAAIAEYMGNGESIVVIDDEAEQRHIASMLLNQLGYTVITAADVEEAFEYLEDRSADLFILDMVMEPKLDGLDTYKKILEKFPGAKAIITSGFSETERVREAQRLGAGEYIRKPYTMKKLSRAIRKELNRGKKR